MHSEAVIPIHANKCPVCGMMFVRKCSAKAWGYAYDGRLCCSYKCMRQAEKADRERMEEQPMETMDKAQARLERDAAAVRMYRSGMSAPEVANNLGVSTSTIYTILKRENVERHPPRKKEEPKMADEKITPAPMTAEAKDPAEEIRRLKARLESQTALATAAVDLMMVWKERYELNERTRRIGAELSAKEAAYFEALRAAKPEKEG